MPLIGFLIIALFTWMLTPGLHYEEQALLATSVYGSLIVASHTAKVITRTVIKPLLGISNKIYKKYLQR